MRLSVILKVHPKLVSLVFFVFWVEKYVSVCWYLVELVSNKLQKLEDLHAVVYASNVAFVGTLRFRHSSLYEHIYV